MEIDENNKIEVSVSENQFVENRIGQKKQTLKNPLKRIGFDALDWAIAPAIVGVVISLSFLISNVVKLGAMSSAGAALTSLLAAFIG